MKFNRNAQISIESFEIADFDPMNPGAVKFNYDGLEMINNLPLEIDVSFEKSITSNMDTASATIKNAELLETFYRSPALFASFFSQFEFNLHISIGYGNELFPVFSGDLQNISIAGGQSMTDNAIILSAQAGQRAISRGVINTIFPAETAYLDIVVACFDVYAAEFGVELTELQDPEGKLAKAIIKPRTVHTQVSAVLNDICRELEFYWGISERPAPNAPQRAYFVDKRSPYDSAGEGAGMFDVNYQTGKVGLTGFSTLEFSFDHLPDRKLNVGATVSASDIPQIKEHAPFEGRINRISGNINNKGGLARYSVECQFLGDDGLTMQSPRRTNAGSELAG